MKKLFYLTVLFILGLTVGCSTDETPSFGSIYGIIIDGKTNEPIRGAEVVLAPGNSSSITGIDGRYEFAELEPGSTSCRYRLRNT